MKAVFLLCVLLIAGISADGNANGHSHSQWEAHHDNNCAPIHDAEQDLHDTLVHIIRDVWFPNTVALNFSVIADMIADNAVLCFSARVDLGCYYGKTDIIDYYRLIDPNVAEIVKYYAMNPAFIVADVVNRTVGSIIEQSFFSFATEQNYTALAFHFFEFDCNNKVTLMTSNSDPLIYSEARIPPISDHNITRICAGSPDLGGIQAACTGSNQVYSSVAACESFLSSIPLENPNAPFGYGNSIGCRDWHLGLARIDPLVHCPHAGPTGGGRCCDTCF